MQKLLDVLWPWRHNKKIAVLRAQIESFESRMVYARIGEAPRPVDAILYVLYQCPRNDEGWIIITPAIETMLKKTLGADDQLKKLAPVLSTLRNQMLQWSQACADKRLPIMAAMIARGRNALTDYIERTT